MQKFLLLLCVFGTSVLIEAKPGCGLFGFGSSYGDSEYDDDGSSSDEEHGHNGGYGFINYRRYRHNIGHGDHHDDGHRNIRYGDRLGQSGQDQLYIQDAYGGGILYHGGNRGVERDNTGNRGGRFGNGGYNGRGSDLSGNGNGRRFPSPPRYDKFNQNYGIPADCPNCDIRSYGNGDGNTNIFNTV